MCLMCTRQPLHCCVNIYSGKNRRSSRCKRFPAYFLNKYLLCFSRRNYVLVYEYKCFPAFVKIIICSLVFVLSTKSFEISLPVAVHREECANFAAAYLFNFSQTFPHETYSEILA